MNTYNRVFTTINPCKRRLHLNVISVVTIIIISLFQRINGGNWNKISPSCKLGLEEVGNNTEYQKQANIFKELNKDNLETNCPCSNTLNCKCDLEKTWLGLRDMKIACQNAQGILCSTDIYSTSKELFIKKESYHCKSLKCTDDEFSQIDICSDERSNCEIELKCSIAVINVNDEKNGAMMMKYLMPIGIGSGVIIICLFIFGLFHMYRQERDARWSFDDTKMVEMQTSARHVRNKISFSNTSRNGSTARRRTVSSSTIGSKSGGYSQLKTTSEDDSNNNNSYVDVDIDLIRRGGDGGGGGGSNKNKKPKAQLV